MLPIDKSQIAYMLSGLHVHGHGRHEQVNVHAGENYDQSRIRYQIPMRVIDQRFVILHCQ